MTFELAVASLLVHEGAYQNRPEDPGNWTGGARGVGLCKGTKWGISAKSYPDLDIAQLTREHATEIYRRDFWVGCGCDALPSQIGDEVFDMAVNSGPTAARICLQRAIGVAADGHIGPVTRAALATWQPWPLLVLFESERMDFLTRLSTWDTFGKGLMRRIASELRDGARELVGEGLAKGTA